MPAGGLIDGSTHARGCARGHHPHRGVRAQCARPRQLRLVLRRDQHRAVLLPGRRTRPGPQGADRALRPRVELGSHDRREQRHRHRERRDRRGTAAGGRLQRPDLGSARLRLLRRDGDRRQPGRRGPRCPGAARLRRAPARGPARQGRRPARGHDRRLLRRRHPARHRGAGLAPRRDRPRHRVALADNQPLQGRHRQDGLVEPALRDGQGARAPRSPHRQRVHRGRLQRPAFRRRRGVVRLARPRRPREQDPHPDLPHPGHRRHAVHPRRGDHELPDPAHQQGPDEDALVLRRARVLPHERGRHHRHRARHARLAEPLSQGRQEGRHRPALRVARPARLRLQRQRLPAQAGQAPGRHGQRHAAAGQRRGLGPGRRPLGLASSAPSARRSRRRARSTP